MNFRGSKYKHICFAYITSLTTSTCIIIFLDIFRYIYRRLIIMYFIRVCLIALFFLSSVLSIESADTCSKDPKQNSKCRSIPTCALTCTWNSVKYCCPLGQGTNLETLSCNKWSNKCTLYPNTTCSETSCTWQAKPYCCSANSGITVGK